MKVSTVSHILAACLRNRPGGREEGCEGRSEISETPHPPRCARGSTAQVVWLLPGVSSNLWQGRTAWQGSCMLCCCCCGSRQGLGASQPAAGTIWNTPILQQPTQPPGAMADQHEDGQEAFLTDEAGQLEGEVLADLEGSAEGEPPALRLHAVQPHA